MLVMNRFAKSCKGLEMTDEGSMDRLSSLPDEFLAHILSFPSTCDAVETSVLSSRWRYLFTLTSNLSFDDIEYFGRCENPPISQNEAQEKSFEKFVYRVLALHKISPIQKFSLDIGATCGYDASDVRVWITAAIEKQVRHLKLSIPRIPKALPNCMFTSQTLVRVEICCRGYMFRVPEIVCFPSLRILELKNMAFRDGDSVKRFFLGCPQLEELGLYLCHLTTDKVCVPAKVLQKLTLSFCRGHISFDAPKLANVCYNC